jgi:hypothetical protein
LWGLGIFFTMMLSWLLLMNYISDSRVLVVYLIWAGVSSILMMATIYWYRFFVSLENMFRLLSLVFMGLSFGIILSAWSDLSGVSLTALNGTVSAWAMFLMIYNMRMLKEKKL